MCPLICLLSSRQLLKLVIKFDRAVLRSPSRGNYLSYRTSYQYFLRWKLVSKKKWRMNQGSIINLKGLASVAWVLLMSLLPNRSKQTICLVKHPSIQITQRCSLDLQQDSYSSLLTGMTVVKRHYPRCWSVRSKHHYLHSHTKPILRNLGLSQHECLPW